MNTEHRILIVHDVRSAHNVGSLFRTADGAGMELLILTGITPVPAKAEALYLTPAEKALRKTALGAEYFLPWKKSVNVASVIRRLKREGYTIVALEQSVHSRDYRKYQQTEKVALLVGSEVTGLTEKILALCDEVLEIPMRGKKNSLNVSVAAGIALYQITSTIEDDRKFKS